ncbi:MAG: tRNA (guanosine(37)-N1)-methyltransferase TrmD [Clostridia bacterium]|nr:tRNA (guanosine(37)-N1)-methyltransferase TrmD [Clostridia bacterium]
MKIELLTIFPEIFDSFLNTSIIGRARANGLLDIHATDIRCYSESKHKNTDDYPFGGGAGMLMMAQPIADAIKDITKPPFCGKRVFMGPRGKTLNQQLAQELAKEPELVILCGHYEGVDQRVLDKYIDMEVSIGDYILTGGETAAMVLIDCVSRLIPGVLGSAESVGDESFSAAGLLEYPQYTRPRVFEGMEVPEILLNGDHKKINQWRREQALIATAKLRPDLLEKAEISKKEREWLQKAIAPTDANVD